MTENYNMLITPSLSPKKPASLNLEISCIVYPPLLKIFFKGRGVFGRSQFSHGLDEAS